MRAPSPRSCASRGSSERRQQGEFSNSKELQKNNLNSKTQKTQNYLLLLSRAAAAQQQTAAAPLLLLRIRKWRSVNQKGLQIF